MLYLFQRFHFVVQYVLKLDKVCGLDQWCAEFADSKVLMLVPGVTLDLKNLINSYSSYTLLMFFELLEVYVITLFATPSPVQ